MVYFVFGFSDTRPEFKAGVKNMATVEWLEYTIELAIKDLEFLFLKS